MPKQFELGPLSMMFGVASQAFLGHVIGGLASVVVWFLSAEKKKKKKKKWGPCQLSPRTKRSRPSLDKYRVS